jgi:threonine dehydrogenase-like Zn-dependent dehydrogenase
MKAVVVVEKGKWQVLDVPVPGIGPYQALVKNEVCGMCSSTDWKIMQGQMTWAGPFPMALGHESVGRVVEVGDKVTKFNVGDRVTRSVLPRTDALNSAFGGFAEYGVVTDGPAIKAGAPTAEVNGYLVDRQNVVPGPVGAVEASLAITLAETASGMRSIGRNIRGSKVVVSGTGAAGLALALWSKMAGASSVTVLGRRPERLELARRRFSDHAVSTADSDWVRQTEDVIGGKADLLIEGVGDVALGFEMLSLMAEGGTAVAYGAPPDGGRYDPRWTTMNVEEQLDYAWAVDMLERQIVRPDWFVTQVWDGLDSFGEAMAQVRAGKVLKGFIRI